MKDKSIEEYSSSNWVFFSPSFSHGVTIIQESWHRKGLAPCKIDHVAIITIELFTINIHQKCSLVNEMTHTFLIGTGN